MARDQAGGPNDHAVAGAVVDWFARHARDLPWRRATDARGGRCPYACLVSELMLQQTQVSRVTDRFVRFMAQFPTVAHLAQAEESRVLAAWSGLGYYRRARLLHRAAREIMARHDGRFPASPAEILALPGVGRYTAGAIASIAFGLPEPIVDGNVSRVLMRLWARDGASTTPDNQRWVWARARALASAAGDAAGPLNEGLMELGATVCTPGRPRCDSCPLKTRCAAHRAGLQDLIPPAKTRTTSTALLHVCLLVRDGQGRVLVEQRPAAGLWGGLWQAPTIESLPGERGKIARWLCGPEGVAAWGRLTLCDSFERRLTHRVITFEVWAGRAVRSSSTRSRRASAPAVWPRGGHTVPPASRRWLTAEELERVGLSTPQRRILLGG
ncbi:MAG: A/G-specific adenine glycosylase [Phycisphaeraceae bacterium]|nr:A/G-specific adenine glycosylase [Phycisphaeraceae bacterium]